MQSMLFVTSELPFPAHSGGKLKSLKLLQELSSQYHVDVACPLKMEDPDHLQSFRSSLPARARVLCDRVSRPRNGANLIRSYLAGVPLNVYRTQSNALIAQIEDKANSYDAIFIDHYEAFQYVPGDYKGKVIYHAHNAYFAFWERYAQVGSGFLHRRIARIEASRVAKEELRVCNRADLVFAAPNDIAKLETLGVDTDKCAYTYHLGDDNQLDLPALQYSQTERKLVYVGYLGWEPNVTGLIWFIDEVWPLLMAEDADLRLHIVGKNPDPRLVDTVKHHPGITLTGFVENLETEFSNSRVCIAPLLFGSGMKVKVLSSLARGLPTVTTSIGAEGIDAINGQHLLCEDAPDKMATAIQKLLEDETLWQQLATQSRKLVSDKYTWQALFTHMHKHLQAHLGEAQSAAA